VLLPGADAEASMEVAERRRVAVEAEAVSAGGRRALA
jgi:hypothetical protein